VGDGPPLLCDLGQLHHLDVFWRHPPYRRLVEALAREFTVIRFDRPGCGLSDRGDADFTVEAELALFDRLLQELGLDEAAVLAGASSAPMMMAVAARRPERVRRLALFGAGDRPWQEALDHRDALDALLRTELGLATDVLARQAAAGCDAAAAQWLSGAYRQAASGAVIAQWLRESAALDVGGVLGLVRCPTLLLHRRGDRLVDLRRARDAAARIRDVVLLPLDGTESVIWEGDADALLRPLLRFLCDGGDTGAPDGATPLSARELEIAGLVAAGLTNVEIGERLGIGSRTVESYLERVRSKLGLVSRTDVAAWVARFLPERS
jgi:pimeloyl-ACP methyl ester carboxylesterase/DNA-binding CsgD family transcriptional regulator